MIVKIQIDATGRNVLIYDRRRTIMVETSADTVKRLTMAPLSKLYAEATVSSEGLLTIGKRVSDRPW